MACDSCVALYQRMSPSSENRTCSWCLGMFWEPVPPFWITLPASLETRGGIQSCLNLLCHTLFKPMGGLNFLNGHLGGIKREDGRWELEGGVPRECMDGWETVVCM